MGEWLRVGTCNPIPDEELSELKNALEEAVGVPVGEQKVIPLGGPNHVVQILIDAAALRAAVTATMVKLGGTAAVGWYLKTVLEPLVKRQGEWIRDNLPKLCAEGFERVATALKAARARGLNTSIGVSLPGHTRGATFKLDTDDPDRVNHAVTLIAYHAEDILGLMSDPPFRLQATAEHSGICFATNVDGDCAWRLEIDEQGLLYAPLEFRCAHRPPQLLRLYFDGPLPDPA